MANPTEEIQTFLYATLTATGAVMALVDGVYDRIPSGAFSGPNKAYISFGPHLVNDDGADCIESGEHTIMLDCWSRAVGQTACKNIVDAVKVALHEREFALTNNALVEMRVPMRRVYMDGDGLTAHGVLMVTAVIEET